MSEFNRDIPYNGLPLLPPVDKLETIDVLKKTISASRALANLNGAIINLPNPQLFLDTIHLQEAKASSEIENILTTNDELYKSAVAKTKRNDTAVKEVISYKEAIWLGIKQLRQKPFITTNLCVDIVQCIKYNAAGIRNSTGTKLTNLKGEVVYTPPNGEQVIRDKMANWEKFVNANSDLDPLIKMAVAHYQFEAIHPFLDGNGRTGRILLLLQLKLDKLLDYPALFLSGYIVQHKNEYYKLLRSVTESGEWTDYLLYMLDMIEQSAIQGLQRLDVVLKLIEKTSNEIREQLPKVYSKDLVEVIFRLPYTKRQNLIDAGFGTPKTVGNYLKALENNGFLRSVMVGKEKLYLNHRLMDVL